jgi:hypothetical protein
VIAGAWILLYYNLEWLGLKVINKFIAELLDMTLGPLDF